MSYPQAGTAAADGERRLALSNEAHRRMIGYLGFLLPFLLYVVSGLRPTPALPRWAPWSSVSSYYYSGAVAVFVGVLFGLALFLFTYQGYTDSWADRALGRCGALFASCVALFPTAPPAHVAAPAWWRGATGTVHFTCAGLLFVVFIVFSIWLFPRSDLPKGELPKGKRVRNRIYRVCGAVMAVAIGWAFVAQLTKRPIVWQESTALWAFSVSWLVKGRAERRMLNAARWMRSRRHA